MAKYGVQTNIALAFESIDLETDSTSEFSLLRYVGNPIQIRNNEYRSSGKKWTLLFYRDFEIDGGQFWIQLEGNFFSAKCHANFFGYSIDLDLINRTRCEFH